MGRESKRDRKICIHTVDSLCSTAENYIVKQLYTNESFFFFNIPALAQKWSLVLGIIGKHKGTEVWGQNSMLKHTAKKNKCYDDVDEEEEEKEMMMSFCIF